MTASTRLLAASAASVSCSDRADAAREEAAVEAGAGDGRRLRSTEWEECRGMRDGLSDGLDDSDEVRAAGEAATGGVVPAERIAECESLVGCAG